MKKENGKLLFERACVLKIMFSFITKTIVPVTAEVEALFNLSKKMDIKIQARQHQTPSHAYCINK